MSSLSVFLVLVGLISGFITIYEFIKSRIGLSRGAQQLTLVFGGVTVILLAASVILAGVFSPQAPGFSTKSVPTSATSHNPTTSATNPTPSPTPTLIPSPTPCHNCVVYQANWSNGMDGWTQSDGWNSVNGMLVNDGSDYNIDGHPTAIAPSLPQGVTNYSVQADIRLDRYTDQGGLASFGVVVRSPDNVGGYKIGVCAGTGIFACDTSGSGYDLRLSNDSFSQGEPVKQSPFHPTLGTWYTYRIDVQGNTITIWLGGAKIFSITDDKYLSAGSVGLWSDRCQISVRNFKITAL